MHLSMFYMYLHVVVMVIFVSIVTKQLRVICDKICNTRLQPRCINKQRIWAFAEQVVLHNIYSIKDHIIWKNLLHNCPIRFSLEALTWDEKT